MGVYEELVERGLIAQTTDEDKIRELVNSGKAVFYIGFDPTADSLHVGHFMAMCLMKRLQMAGNTPIALVGGGTAMIGDPTGRTDMRTMMTTEIIGLSHAERQIVANVVRFNTAEFCYYDELAQKTSVSREEYLVIAKLTAILRAANALDRSHYQRIRNINVSIRGDELYLSAQSDEDLTLERGTLEEKNSLFEEVFNLKPVLHQIRQNRK